MKYIFLPLLLITFCEIYSQVHMGKSFFASAQMLEEELRKGNKKDIEYSVRRFEAYSTQTTLPLKRQ